MFWYKKKSYKDAIFIKSNGVICDHSLTKELEIIAREKIKYFHKFLEKASKGNEQNIDWWTSQFSSRNCFSSPLYLNLFGISLICKLIESGKKPLIYSDSLVLFILYRKLYVKKGLNKNFVKLDINLKNYVEYFFKFFVVIFGSLPILLIRHLVVKKKDDEIKIKKEIDIFSCYATPNWWSKDTYRYFPGLTNFYSLERLKTIYFVPRAIGRFWKLKKDNAFYRTGQKNVLIIEDYLKIFDYIYAWLHWYRILKLRPPKLRWGELNVTLLFYKEVMSPSSMYGAMKAILYYQFIFRLNSNKIKIRSFVNFLENQTADKALHKGIRDFFPNCRNVGYEGYSPVTPYYCCFPVQNEMDCGVLPDILALPGDGFISYVDQFVKDIKTILVPHLRCASIYRYSKKQQNDNFRILFTLPHLLSYLPPVLSAASMLSKVFGDRIEISLKPHPTMQMDLIIKSINQFDSLNEKNIVDGDIYQLLTKSDLLISTASGTLVEAMALGIPVIVLRLPFLFLHNPIPLTLPKSLWKICDDEEDLIKMTKKILNSTDKHNQNNLKLSKKILKSFFEPISKKGVEKILESQIEQK